MVRIILSCLFSLCCLSLIAQSKNEVVLSGFLLNSTTKEPVRFGNLFILETNEGVSADENGYFVAYFEDQDLYTLRLSSVGYEDALYEVELLADTSVNLFLDPQNNDLDELIVYSDRDSLDLNTQLQKASRFEFVPQEIRKLPALFGEQDILKSAQIYPGIKPAYNGTSGLIIRNGLASQNLFLLDNVPVYSTSHLFGIISVFTAENTDQINLYTQGFPARFGDRLSSVFDIRTKDGSKTDYSNDAGLSLFSGFFRSDGYIVKDKLTYSVYGRRSFWDILLNNAVEGGPQFNAYFYDILSKLSWTINEKDRLYLTVFLNRDKFGIKQEGEGIINDTLVTQSSENSLGWNNGMLALRWNRIINSRLVSDLQLAFSTYNYSTKLEEKQTLTFGRTSTNDELLIRYFSRTRDLRLMNDYSWFIKRNLRARFGAGATFHFYDPGALRLNLVQNNTTNIDTTFGAFGLRSTAAYAYGEVEYNPISNLKISAGLRLNSYFVDNSNFTTIDPRLLLQYQVLPSLMLQGTFTKMTQNLHGVSVRLLDLPNEIWLPATELLPPELGTQYSLGFRYKPNAKFTFGIDVYEKTVQNAIALGEGEGFLDLDSDWEEELEVGNLDARGFEAIIQFNSKKVNFTSSYTLAKAENQFNNINLGNPFPSNNDQRHSVTGNFSIDISKKWSVNLNGFWGTGLPTSIPDNYYLASPGTDPDGQFGPYFYYSQRNNYRLDNQLRIDASFTYRKWGLFGPVEWSFGAYNLTNSLNPFRGRVIPSGNSFVFQQQGLFGFLPIISYRVKIL